MNIASSDAWMSAQDKQGRYFINGNPYLAESLNAMMERFTRHPVNEEGVSVSYTLPGDVMLM